MNNGDSSGFGSMLFARRTVDLVLVGLRDPVVSEPERERAQATRFWQIFGDPCSVRSERAREILDEREKEALAGLARGPFQDAAEGVHRGRW